MINKPTGYQGRIVLVGNYQGDILAGNVLQSRSEQDRVIMPWKNGANIVPSKAKVPEVIEQLRKGDLSITHNSYPCVFGFKDNLGNPYIVGCNGRFAGVIRRKISRGSNVEEAINVALDASDPQPKDPRMVAIAYRIEGKPQYTFGEFDIENQPYRQRPIEVEQNKVRFLSLSSQGQVGEINVQDVPLEKLAEFLFTETLGTNPDFGIGASVCLHTPDGFKINVFNRIG